MDDSKQLDASAVTAVLQGDIERYRELVERHERQVYALAWSRLGDATLAEEATQQAFIRAYRRLWLLGNGSKFSGWISVIVRNVAISTGLRRRRELIKRERWAMEQDSNPQEVAESDSVYSPEMLRQALAELPASHRECLVLFYLEGKSGEEAAEALGISESALRVRLHRARAVLRRQMEQKLESSLAKLCPTKALVPAVMASVLASASAKAATTGGAGAALLATLAKIAPLKWLFWLWTPMLLALTLLPAYLVQCWQRREERRNFRDPQGFRAKLYDRADNSSLAGIALGLLSGLLAALMGAGTVLGVRWVFLVLGLAALATAAALARQLQILRSRVLKVVLASLLTSSAVFLAISAHWLPLMAAAYCCFLTIMPLIFGGNPRLLRMDYNLFLRASQDQLRPLEGIEPLGDPFSRKELRFFAQFLAERRLVIDFRWAPGGLVLYLPTVVGSPMASNWPWLFVRATTHSRITLCWDATVLANCSAKDLTSLEKMGGSLEVAQMERQVSLAVSQAWRSFRAGKTADAERAIGQIPDADVFVVPPSKMAVFRWGRMAAVGMMAFGLLATWGAWFFAEELSGFKRVNLTEDQAKTFLSLVSTNPNPVIKDVENGGYRQKGFTWAPSLALFTCLVVPETNQFAPRQLQMIRESIGFTLASTNKSSGLGNCFSPLAKRAVVDGWIDWSDLGLTAQDVSEAVRQHPDFHELEFKTDYLLVRERAWSWVEKKRWEVKRVGQYTWSQLRWLRAAKCLDLVDREELIQQILSVQTLSANPSSGVPIHDWRAVHGLFFTPCFPALPDTYYAVAALEMLGGLDQMDREACINGILRVHRGKGFFESPRSGSFNEYHIDGSAQDTIAAYETLRILGGLDRVKDLDKWQFRTDRRHVAKDQVTWSEIEAWVATKRLQMAVSTHKADPSLPYHSLLGAGND